ncbi:MAG TPA: FMN-binding protein [Micromonosporaceae bacterium]|nr:FMN-binding protein [Micromonosporaceae bacterium]
MRRIVTALAGTVTALVMLFGYHTSTAGSGTTAAVPTGPLTTGTSGSSSSSGSSGSGRTYTGDTVQTQWGPVQVQITVSGGRVTEVTTLQHPSGNPRDEEINAYALPVLRESALSAQSADIDLVSGATVTSQGYVGSLQSALDQANL